MEISTKGRSLFPSGMSWDEHVQAGQDLGELAATARSTINRSKKDQKLNARILDVLSKLRSDLEDHLFQDCPRRDKASESERLLYLNVYYGDAETQAQPQNDFTKARADMERLRDKLVQTCPKSYSLKHINEILELIARSEGA
jgi:hypothetical protein